MTKFNLKSMEDVSAKRKFVTLFLLMSLFPFVILVGLVLVFYIRGSIKIDFNLFFWLVFFVGVFTLAGFMGMCQTLGRLSKISDIIKNIPNDRIPKHLDVKVPGDNEIAQITRSFNEVVRKLEGTIKELEKSKNVVQDVLIKAASGMSFAENINAFVDLILKTTVGALYAKIGLLFLIDDSNKELVISSFCGLDESHIKSRHLSLDTEVVSWVIKQKKPLLIPRLQKIPTAQTEDADLIFQPPLICAPLMFQNKVTGVILISGKEDEGNFEEDELIILSHISSQVALAIMNAKLNADAQRTYMETITALALAVEARDLYNRGHSDRVGEYAVKISKALELGEGQIEIIKNAARLHDVGKIGLADEILNKPDALDVFEREIMQQHPLIGEGIIIPLHGFSSLRDPIRHHHEWLNGEGYPDHLVGEQISLEARILSVADAIDTMASERPYKKKMSLEETRQELIKYKGIRYDANVVDVAISVI